MSEEAAAPLSPSPAVTADAPHSPSKKERIRPIDTKIAELNESQAELAARLQGLKQELLNWKSKLNMQVKTYKDELLQLKDSLNTEVEQIRSQFQELRATLQQQQDDVTKSLGCLGDAGVDATRPEAVDSSGKEDKAEKKPEEERNAVLNTEEPHS